MNRAVLVSVLRERLACDPSIEWVLRQPKEMSVEEMVLAVGAMAEDLDAWEPRSWLNWLRDQVALRTGKGISSCRCNGCFQGVWAEVELKEMAALFVEGFGA